jgi:hypothetical protein
MHAFTKLYSGGHIYNANGIGEIEFDPASLVSAERIVETRSLDGFVEQQKTYAVTYESHKFWVHFLRYSAGRSERDSGVLVRVNHGGGWEVWRGDEMLAEALRGYGDDNRGLFKLCWFMIDAARSAEAAGAQCATTRYRKAFIEGRLKKRKMPGRDACKVWIEPEAANSTAAAMHLSYG